MKQGGKGTGLLVVALVAFAILLLTGKKAPPSSGSVPIATALPASFNTPTVLNSVYFVNPDGTLLVYNPARPPELNTLTALTPGNTYIIFTNVNTTATIGQITYTFTAGVALNIIFTP